MDPAQSQIGGLLVNAENISGRNFSLEIHGLTVVYGDRVALSNVSLTVAPGEIVALIGPNGAGKSTLINAVSGILPIRAGKVTYGEQDLTVLSNAQRARILGVVPQAHQLGGAFTVAQTVMLGRTAYMSWLGRERPEDVAAVERAMQQTAVDRLAGRRNAELSGGEQQRVLLARALAQKTPVLLLDEPTNHLDLQYQIGFLSLVRELCRRQSLAVLMAMHDLNQVATYADRVAFLVEGKLLALGVPGEVMTMENITQAYNIPIEIIQHPQYHTPLILPRRELS
jgi:iron complex transport system ATP-binding protein